MIKEIQLSWDSRRERLRYGLGAICIGIAALLLLLSFRGGAAQGLAAPLAPSVPVMSSETSIVAANNTVGQAIAGELVTVTAVFNVPGGDVIHNASPRVVLQDGLYPVGASHAYTLYTGIVGDLRTIEGSGNIVAFAGALLVFHNQGTITGPDAMTMTVYAVRTQKNYVGTPADIAHGANLRVQGILRYCTGDPSCLPTLVVNTPANSTAGQVAAIQPLINTTYASSYLDAAQLGEGGGQVRLTFTASAAANRPTAYDIVYTATLGSGLTHAASNGTGVGAGNVTVMGETTYVTWTVPGSMVAPQTWQAVVTATLPNTFTVGREFTYFGTAAYETFAGDVPYEGKYATTPGTVPILRPGVSITTKTSVPGPGAVTMGDRITYTLTFRQAPNTELLAPYYVDTLPRGFHYVSDTLTVQGATLLSYEILEGPSAGTGLAARYFENLRLNMDTLPVTSTVRQITLSYATLNTGLDYRGAPVWDSAANMQAANNTSEGNTTGAMLFWTPPSGFIYGNLGGSYTNLTTKANSTGVTVIQPFLANAQFDALRNGTAPVNIGDPVSLLIRMRNSGAAPGVPAYELQVCDTLPEGFAYVTTFSCTPVGSGTPACPAFTTPASGSTGKICWAFDGLPRTNTTAQYYELNYQAQVLPTAVPGVYSNAVSVEGYSSKPGIVEGERDYSDFPQALISDTCGAACITVLGLAADKQAWVEEVSPGALLTYTLWLTDTRNTTPYTGVVITDTYDTLLSFVSADPPVTTHHVGTRRLIWDVASLSAGGARQIVLTMRVAETIAERYVLTNTMTWDSAQSLPFTVAETTAIAVPALHLYMDGPQATHAGEEIAYTVLYSNTGSASAPVVLTLDYGPYVEFLSSSPLTPRSGTDNIFDDVVGAGESRALTVNLRVQAPLPYDLAGPLQASALLVSPGAESKQAGISVTLDRPVLVLEKTGPIVAPAVGTIAEYVIRVRNLGTYAATGAVITDTWGANLGYRANNSSFGWVLSGDETYATQSLGTLGVGESVTKFFQVDIVTLAISYTNQIDLTTQQTTQQSEIEQTWQASIATAKSVTPVPAFPGRVLTYTVYYTSTATFPMVNALVTDTLPSNFVYLGQSTAQASGCQSSWTFTAPGSGGGGNAVWSCATLFANASGRFTIWGEVKAEAEGTDLTNRTTTSALDIPIRPIEKPLVTRVARPWLRVDKAVVPTHPVAPGDWLTYTLTYENDGTDPAYNVIIKDQLPAQVAFASCSGGSSCNHSTGLVTWNLAQVPVGTVGSVEVVVQVTAGTAGQTAVNANYTIQSNLLSVDDTITGLSVSSEIRNPNLAAEKLADPLYVTQAADRITYTIGLTNDGGGILHNVVVTDAIDARTIVDTLTLPPECVVSGEAAVDEIVTCDIGTMAQGAIKVVEFKVYLAGAPVQGDFVTNTAYRYSDETASEPSNETTVWITTGCIPPHNVSFTVSDNPQAGQPVVFTAAASGSAPLTYAWTFGDTQTGTGQVVEHTYAVSGTYKVDLTVNNGCVAPVTVSKDVYVPGAPEITLTPMSFTKSADQGSTTALEDTLTVSNTGTANLIWSVSVMTPTEATWLRIAIGGGDPETVILPPMIAPGASIPVTVYFDPTDLAAGTYTAQLRIESNDADEGVVLVPVTFIIRAPDEVYYIYLPLVLRNSQ